MGMRLITREWERIHVSLFTGYANLNSHLYIIKVSGDESYVRSVKRKKNLHVSSQNVLQL